MEYLVVAVILYFILQTAGNLIRLLRGKEEGASAQQASSSSSRTWKGPSPREQTGRAHGEPTFWNQDIEDATWQDLEP